jgi:hypothetical protein
MSYDDIQHQLDSLHRRQTVAQRIKTSTSDTVHFKRQGGALHGTRRSFLLGTGAVFGSTCSAAWPPVAATTSRAT